MLSPIQPSGWFGEPPVFQLTPIMNHGLLLRQEVKKYVAPPGVFKSPIPCLAPSMLQYGVATVPG